MHKLLIAAVALISSSVSGDLRWPNRPVRPDRTCTRIFNMPSLVALSANVPFAWVRSAPDSSASIVYTITAHGKFNLHPEKIYEGSEIWIEVNQFSNSTVRGWVELASLMVGYTRRR